MKSKAKSPRWSKGKEPRHNRLSRQSQISPSLHGLSWSWWHLDTTAGLPQWLSKESAYNTGDVDLIPEPGRSPGEGNGNLVQYSCWKIPRTEESSRLQSVGLQTAGHNWACTHRYHCLGLLLLFGCLVISDPFQLYGLQPARLLCSWDFLSKNIGVSCHFFLQGIFPTHRLNLSLLCLLHCRQFLYLLSCGLLYNRKPGRDR